jgi:hypothetical protein
LASPQLVFSHWEVRIRRRKWRWDFCYTKICIYDYAYG